MIILYFVSPYSLLYFNVNYILFAYIDKALKENWKDKLIKNRFDH